MEQMSRTIDQIPTWFVGAVFGSRDQTDRFVAEGIWDIDRDTEAVHSIRPGERIALKANANTTDDVPFDHRGHPVSVMEIKAIGTVKENIGDGRRLRVAWTPVDPSRKWYFYTNIKPVWKVQYGTGAQPDAAAALVRFTFDTEEQDIDWFRNLPYWRSRFGDGPGSGYSFLWTKFYAALADSLVQYRTSRQRLISGLVEIATRMGKLFPPIQDKYKDGNEGPLRDVCPFTTIGCFNRGTKDETRRAIAKEIGTFLKVQESTPNLIGNQDGIPLLTNMAWWYFDYEQNQDSDDIEKLWRVFEDAIAFADAVDEGRRDALERSYDDALSVKRVAASKLTIGLFWIRPWSFPPLDKNSITYIKDVLQEEIPDNGDEYLDLRDRLLDRFHDEECPVHSFPELSLRAYAPVPVPVPARARARDEGASAGQWR